MNKRWEYKLLEIDQTSPAQLEAMLNKLGSECWEVFDYYIHEEYNVIFMKRATPIQSQLNG